MERDAGGIPPSRPKDPVFVAAKLEPATQQTRSEEGEEEEEEKQATRRREQDCEEEEQQQINCRRHECDRHSQ